jgi:cytochrome c biogenesis protein CcdA
VVIMLGVAYAYLQEGVLTAFTMLCNVFLAGLVAFNFWEPCAAELDPLLAGTLLHGYEDSLCLVLLFTLTLGLLRWTTNTLANLQPEYHPVVQQGGAVVFGLLTGYLVAGFLLCVLQTLPWHENFMNFDEKIDPEAPKARARRVLPPDRVWLALMHRASVGPFSQAEEAGFDPGGSFEARYARLRRYSDSSPESAARGP